MHEVVNEKVTAELLVLDAHGVIFNNPWSSFLAELARSTGRSESEVQELWYREIRVDAWLGAVSDEELWSRLSGQEDSGDAWRAMLERRYQLGPVASYLEGWHARLPIWILSNHRTAWLLSRLSRFDMGHCFDRILVSDRLGAMKPDPAVFGEVVSSVRTPRAALFVDDKPENVETALRLGLSAVAADPGQQWVNVIDEHVTAIDASTAQPGA